MSTQTKLAHPIRTLREQSKAIEKALAACLTTASPEPVHRLRTTIRRFEAQFALLAQFHKLPEHHHEPKKLLKTLKRLRRCAGNLRDLDVQQDLVAANTTTETASDASRLRDVLKDRRNQQAIIFLNLAQQLHQKVSKELERLLATLPQPEKLAIANDQVISLAQRSFELRSSSLVTTDQLHAVRKAAKVARYMCEVASGSATALKIGKQFEAIQDKGGQWHDWLQLAQIAAGTLKRGSLTNMYNKKRDLKLASYRRRLMNQPGYTHPSK
jgi:CHAD domain-containing protein